MKTGEKPHAQLLAASVAVTGLKPCAFFLLFFYPSDIVFLFFLFHILIPLFILLLYCDCFVNFWAATGKKMLKVDDLLLCFLYCSDFPYSISLQSYKVFVQIDT